MIKTCTQCNLCKPIVHFTRPGGKRIYGRCDDCKKLGRVDLNRKKDSELKRHFGITLSQYNEMSRLQDHKCAICRQPESTGASGQLIKLAVDHDHKTGKIRGLLCQRCNKAIGLLGDSPAIVYAALGYLMGGGRHRRDY